MTKKKKILALIVFLLVLAVIVTLSVLNHISQQIKYNPEGTSGNTPCNLLNGGMFAEYGGVIYFANPYDHNKLYSMNSNCTEPKKLADDTVSHINVCENYVFYIRNNYNDGNKKSLFRAQLFGIVRMKHNGSQRAVLTSDITNRMSLYGNLIYYNRYKDNKIYLYSQSIDGKENNLVYKSEIAVESLNYGSVYYSSSQGNDHNIYSLNVETGISTKYLEGNTYLPAFVDGFLYYINQGNGYKLIKYNPVTKEKETLSELRCINYNVYDNMIFFQAEGDGSGFYRLDMNTGETVLITNAATTSISCTSMYTFFSLYGSDAIYRTPTFGAPKMELIQIR